MAEPTIQLGGGNWAGKTDNLLGYYKEGERFYKQDFTFSRSTTGTYTDSDGYIQEMPYNLASYSEEFNNAAYSLTESSITANAINSPIGTLTADKLIENTSNNLHRVGQGSISVISGEVYTFSFYVKAAERNELELQRINTSGTVFNSISVTTANLTNGTLSVGSNVTASSIENVGDDWYRISISLTAIANGSGGLNIGMQINGSFFYQGDGVSGVYLWGFQAVKGSSAKTYFPTTTRLNMPRVDYLNNSNGSLILEPQRTNVITQSQAFDNSYWTKSGASVTSGFTSPDGTNNAYKLVEGTNNGGHTAYKLNVSISSGVNYTYSLFVKGTERVLQMVLSSGFSSNFCNFDLSDGTIGSNNGLVDSNITSFSNGWYRCDITALSNGTSAHLELILAESKTSSRYTTYEGNGTSGVYIYGAQLEQGSYATSLIKTSGSSVTRNKDACSISNVADRINSSEGVLFVEMKNDIIQQQTISLFESNNNHNSVQLGLINGNIRCAIGRSNQYVLGTVSPAFDYANGQINKYAIVWNGTTAKTFINGQLKNTITTPSPLNLKNLAMNNPLGSENMSGNIEDLRVYNTALSDTELATLTTL